MVQKEVQRMDMNIIDEEMITESVDSDIAKFSTPAKEYNTSKLPKNYQKVLEFLEIRSYETRGDTKIFDKKISEVLGISMSTVKRALRRLEVLKFIARKTDRKFNKMNKNHFCDRIIRCFRVFLHHGSYPIRSLWKYDNRPKTNHKLIIQEQGKKAVFDFETENPPFFTDAHMAKGSYLSNLEEYRSDLLFDFQIEAKFSIMDTGRFHDSKKAMDILGFPKLHKIRKTDQQLEEENEKAEYDYMAKTLGLV